jgi:hypothetical protein
MKHFIPRTPAISVATLCLCNRSGALSKLRVTGAVRRVLGILMTAVLGVVLLAQPTSAAVTFSIVADLTTTAPGHGPFTGLLTPGVSGGNVAFVRELVRFLGLRTRSYSRSRNASLIERLWDSSNLDTPTRYNLRPQLLL